MAPRPTVTVIPAAVAFWRQKRSLSRAELARLAGLSEAMIGHAETGERNLSRDAAQRVATALDLPIEALALVNDEVA